MTKDILWGSPLSSAMKCFLKETPNYKQTKKPMKRAEGDNETETQMHSYVCDMNIKVIFSSCIKGTIVIKLLSAILVDIGKMTL